MNYIDISRFFSKKNLFKCVFDDNFNAELFRNELIMYYRVLNKEYRNEYFFKNTLFNKYLLGKYSLNTTSALNEVVIGNSKADFAIINHQKGIVYEIKTDLDNLERLIYQIEDYYKVFSEIYVVTSEKHYYPVYRFIKEFKPSVGIIVLADNVTLSIRKKAVVNDYNLNYENIFKLLRKKEYEEIIIYKFGELPNVKPVQRFKACLDFFKQLPIKQAQELVYKQLRKRIQSKNIKKIEELPMPIRWLVYTSDFTHKELEYIFFKLCEKRGIEDVLSNN